MSTAAIDATLYRFGVGVGLRTLPRAPKNALKLLAVPVEYVRFAETRYVVEHLDLQAGQRVLDVGSPKLLSLYLAARLDANVWATDLLDYFVERYAAYAQAAMRGRHSEYRMEVADGRALPYARASFDRAFSISAIEHIPGDGDSEAVRELGRVVKPGGLVCLTVPWSDRGYLEEFRSGESEFVYWAKDKSAQVFYQRAYDRPTLDRRIVNAGPFELADLSFWGERRVPMEDWVLNRKLPKLVRWSMLPAHLPLSRVFLRPLQETERAHKKVACITLRRTRD
jgi:SAM-dependent methyltransferase